MKKRLFSLFMSLIMAISLIGALPVVTAEAAISGNYYYEILDNGTIQITRYIDSESNVKIPETIKGKKVVSIGDQAFTGCYQLVNVIIPNNITSIGNSAFSGCQNLSEVTMSNNIKSINRCTFIGCKNLKKINIPTKVKSIGWMAFRDCNKLTNITFPKGLNYIDYSAFYGCGSLKSITIPNSVTTIGSSAFECCYNLTNVSILNSSLYIGEQAFSFCTNLKSVKMGNSVKILGDNAFSECNNLTSITIPNSVSEMGKGVFSACSNLTNVTIGNGITTINEYAFENCSNLKDILIPNSVTKILYKSFNNCCRLNKITIPRSIVNIEKYAFYDCESIKNVYYLGSKKEWNKISIGSNNGWLTSASIHYSNLSSPEKVSNFKASSTSTNSIKLTWNKVKGATGYTLYQQKNGKWTKVKSLTGTSYTVPKLKAGTTYKFAVKAYKKIGNSLITSPSFPTVSTSTNPATVNFKLTAGSKKATVKWSKVTGATGYKVYYKTSKNGSWKCLKTANNKTTSYTKTGLKKGKTYYFTVKAYRTVGGKTYNGAFTTKGVKVK